jgi:integration host factor subunit alpha
LSGRGRLARTESPVHQKEHILSRREAQQLVSCLSSIIIDTFSRGEDLLISGFGKFLVKQKKFLPGRNPSIGKV